MANRSANNKTSVLVAKQLPEFIRTQHELFVQFIEYYYKHLEQDGNVLYTSKNFSDFLDIDVLNDDIQNELNESISDHVENPNYHVILTKIFKTYLHYMPEDIIADKTVILKHAKDFYRSKGTEKSIKFLIRALFGKESSIYIPKTDILKASQGVWFIKKSLKITDIEMGTIEANGDVSLYTANSDALINFVGHTIFGANSNARAIVENTSVFYENGRLVNELLISAQVRDFINGEYIISDIIFEGRPTRLKANLFSGIIDTVNIISPGSGYQEGTEVPLVPNTFGGKVIIDKVSAAGLSYIIIENSGSGFQTNDSILIVGGGSGLGATGVVASIDNSGDVHPNSYNLVATSIGVEANTPIGNSVYSNLNGTNANVSIANGMSYWTYANTGPLKICLITNPGSNYTSIPSINVTSNAAIRSLGILGKMEIYEAGNNYTIGDQIEIINRYGSFGTGAAGEVVDVDENGSITKVKFVQIPGNQIGGTGYNQRILPIANVVSATGSGANIVVTSIIGSGDKLSSVGEGVGVIKELKIVSGGSGYYEPPYLDFAAIPFGTGAQANVTIISGVYTYPGRFVNDDGFINAFNFIQDRDYYQNYSYVIRTDESFNRYRKVINDLVHPIGTKVFADYFKDLVVPAGTKANAHNKTYNSQLLLSNYYVNDYKPAAFFPVKIKSKYVPRVQRSGYFLNTTPLVTTFAANNDIIEVETNGNRYREGKNVYLIFDNVYSNIVNALYTVTISNDYFFQVSTVDGNTVTDSISGPVQVYDPEMLITALNHNEPIADKATFQVNGNVVIVSTNGSYYKPDDVIYLEFSSEIENVSNGLYSVDSANSNAITLFTLGGNIASNTSGLVTVYGRTSGDYIILENDIVYLDFRLPDPYPVSPLHALANGEYGYNTYKVRGAGLDYITIEHPNVYQMMANVATGYVDVYSNVVTVISENHGLNSNDPTYLTFDSGDIANSNSGYYNVRSVKDENTFIIKTPEFMFSVGEANVYTRNVLMFIPDHGLETDDNLYVLFPKPNLSYDYIEGNTTINDDVFGLYYATVFDLNTFIIKTDMPLGNTDTFFANVFLPGISYSNATIYREDHGFNEGDLVIANFEGANISNTIYTVTSVIDSNSYVIYDLQLQINANTFMKGPVSVGLYK